MEIDDKPFELCDIYTGDLLATNKKLRLKIENTQGDTLQIIVE